MHCRLERVPIHEFSDGSEVGHFQMPEHFPAGFVGFFRDICSAQVDQLETLSVSIDDEQTGLLAVMGETCP